MSCCCCLQDNDYYDDVVTTKSDAGPQWSSVELAQHGRQRRPPTPLRQQRMERALDKADSAETTGSDRIAVAWMRSRNESLSLSLTCLRQGGDQQPARRPVELSDDAAANWERQAREEPAFAFPFDINSSTDITTQDLRDASASRNRFPSDEKTIVRADDRLAKRSLGAVEEELPSRRISERLEPTDTAAPFKNGSYEHGVSEDIQDELDAIVLFLKDRNTTDISHSESMTFSIATDNNLQQQLIDPIVEQSKSPILEQRKSTATEQYVLGRSSSTLKSNASREQPLASQSPPRTSIIRRNTAEDAVRHEHFETRDIHIPHQCTDMSVRPTSNPAPKALSDFDSEVNSEVRERYLFACRLLKTALIERESMLLPNEMLFLHELLEETERSPTEAQLLAVETASATLESDPLFRIRSCNEEKQHRFSLHERPNPRVRRQISSSSHDYYAHRDVASLPNLIDEEATDVGTTVSSTINQHYNTTYASNIAAVARFDGREFPFYMLGVTPDFKIGVLTPALMESLRGFFPYAVADQNFWLKYSMQRDGISLPILLSKVRTSKYTVLGVETRDGHVFGVFCSTPWRVQPSWYGNGDCFLWRIKRSRLDGYQRRTLDFDNEMEVYPYTGKDKLIQYCSQKSLAVGGGDFGPAGSPFPDEPTGIGFMLDGDLQGGETNCCATFNNPRLASRLSRTHNEFDIVNLEVWTSTPCVTVDEAEKVEMHQHFVEEFDRDD